MIIADNESALSASKRLPVRSENKNTSAVTEALTTPGANPVMAAYTGNRIASTVSAFLGGLPRRRKTEYIIAHKNPTCNPDTDKT